MKNLVLFAIALLLSGAAQAGTVTQTFTLSDFDLPDPSLDVRFDKSGTIRDVSTDRGALRPKQDLPGFTAPSRERLTKVDVSLDFAISGGVFAIYQGAANLNDPNALVTGDFTVRTRYFVLGFPLIGPAEVIGDITQVQNFSVTSLGCTVSQRLETCVTRDGITFGPSLPVAFSFVGRDAALLTRGYRLGAVFDVERTAFSSTLADDFSVGLFSDSPTSPFFTASADVSVTFQTAAIPLPASALLLLSALSAGALLAGRRTR